MTTMQLNAEIMKNLDYLMDDEGALERVLKYLKKIVSERTKDETLMTEEDFFQKVDQARDQIRRGEGISFDNLDAMNSWLNTL